MKDRTEPGSLLDFEALSFDCYGTVIDWETGIGAALAPWLQRHALEAEMKRVLEAFERCEPRHQSATPSLRYPKILERTLVSMGEELGAPCTPEEAQAFGDSVGSWPPFSDAPAALSYLARRYRLVILSNVDRRSFARTQQRLGVDFHRVLTAEEIGSYKPSRRNFRYLLSSLRADGVERRSILHVAQSRFHDIAPAGALGIATCWIDRRGSVVGGGPAPPPSMAVEPDYRFATLGDLVAELQRLAG